MQTPLAHKAKSIYQVAGYRECLQADPCSRGQIEAAELAGSLWAPRQLAPLSLP